MIIASKIGMHIPPKQRVGPKAYKFFRDNIKYYEVTFDRGSEAPPTLQDIYMSRNRVNYLMKFRDEEIVKKGTRFTSDYNDRLEMIKDFIRDNVSVHGEFGLANNSRHSYTTKAKVITFTNGSGVREYSVKELILQLGPNNFAPIALYRLRQLILEKLEQWRHRDGFSEPNGPLELYSLLNLLESHLSSNPEYKVMTQRSAYLGNPIVQL